MLDLSSKYSINIKTNSETFTVNSTLQPNFSQYDLNKVSVIWFRQPPPPYQIEQLGYNNNKKSYKCNSLDYQCSIICKVFNENGKELNRFDYGPIQTIMYNRVQVLLFNNVKKCLLSFSHVPTLINPQNNNKYQLTQQDIRSIYLKIQNSVEDNQKQQLDQISLLKNQKVIVVQNLFQRLILLKLFHQIPNSMYCHSMQILQILFYDQTSCNMTLYALNRFKYQKKQTSQTSKSMFNQPCQQLFKYKWMKKSNQSLIKYKNINNSNNNQKQSLLLLNKEKSNNQFNNVQGFKKCFQFQINQSITKKSPINQIQPKRQFIPLIGFKKSPKQSINSGTQSMISCQSSLATQSKKSLHQLSNQQKQSLAQRQKQLNKNHNKKSLSPGQLKRISKFKQPKVSILSTQINSIKGPRQQKLSFPQSPLGINLANTLKSSQLLIKPNQFKSSLALRRSQDEIKTPRIDMEDDQQQAKIKKKILQTQPRNDKNIVQESNTSLAVNINSNKMMEQSTSQYFNEFQNLLFEGQKSLNQQTQQMCLNDSFIRMEEQQQRQKQKNLSPIHITQSQQSLKQDLKFIQNLAKTHTVIQIPSLSSNLALKQTFLLSSPTKSQRNIISLKQKFIAIAEQNHQLKMKNEQLIRQIEESKFTTQKKSQITKYQQEIQKMKFVQNNLLNEINLLKHGAVIRKKRSFVAKNGIANLIEGSSKGNNNINNVRPNGKLESPQKLARNIFPNNKHNTNNQYTSNKGNQLTINTNITNSYANNNFYTDAIYYSNNNYINNNYSSINQFNNPQNHYINQNQPHAYQFNQLNNNRFKINQTNNNHQSVQLNQMIGQVNSNQTILKVQNNFNKFPNQDYKPSSGILSPPRQSEHINAIIMNNDNIISPKLAGRRSQQGDKVCFGNWDGLDNTASNLFSPGDVIFMKFNNDPDYHKFRTNQSYSYKLNTPNNKVQEHNKPFKESYQKY